MSLTDDVRDVFNREHVQVNMRERRIEVYWLRGSDGREWVPFSGGPVYREQAKDQAQWLAGHIHEFRELLPEDVQDWPIVVGELDARMYPGRFYPERRYGVLCR